MLSVKQGGIKYHFCVFGMIWLATELRSPRSLANTLTEKICLDVNRAGMSLRNQFRSNQIDWEKTRKILLVLATLKKNCFASNTPSLPECKRLVFSYNYHKQLRTITFPSFHSKQMPRELNKIERSHVFFKKVVDSLTFNHEKIMRIFVSLLSLAMIINIPFNGSVGWGSGIHWLQLCRGVRLPQTSVLDMTLNNLMVRLQ